MPRLAPPLCFHYGGDMARLKVFVAESVKPEEFYHRCWEGHVVEEIVRLLDGKTSYRIVLNADLLRRAIKTASEMHTTSFTFLATVAKRA